MRTGLLVILAARLCLPLLGDDIILKDGRVLHDAKIVSQTLSAVAIRYAGGLSLVDKTLLPDKLLETYPLDPNTMAEMKAKAQAQAKIKQDAERGDARAEIKLGEMYRSGDGERKDSVEAFNWFRRAADQGNRGAEFYLGLMFSNGEGTTKDIAGGIKWYVKAAKQGSTDAAYNLGLIYGNGDGVPQDPQEAAGWYRKAAMGGDTDAQINLGYMLSNGEGVPKDEVEGLAWTYIAAASGDQTSAKNLAIMEDNLGRELTLAAQQRSRQLLREINETESEAATPSSKESATPQSPLDDAVKGMGTGSIVSADGVVLTAAHVVLGATRIRVSTAQGMRDATVLGVDQANDVAIIRLSSGTYSALPVIPSRGVRLGQTVSTIGFPEAEIQGFSPKVTKGEINSFNGFQDDPREWQISVPVQKGNSGGPLLDENGNLIGIVTSKLGIEASNAAGDLLQNVNYAVKATYALPLIEPYLPDNSSSTKPLTSKPPRFEDMVDKAKQSVVMILVY